MARTVYEILRPELTAQRRDFAALLRQVNAGHYRELKSIEQRLAGVGNGEAQAFKAEFDQLEQRLSKLITRATRQDQLTGFLGDEAFQAVAMPVLEDLKTYLGPERLYVLWQAIRNVAHLRLAAAEVGSYRGGSAYFIASSFVALTGQEVPLYVFDTFEGHPQAAVGEQDKGQRVGGFGGTSLKRVQAYLSPFERIELHPGDVSEQLDGLEETTYGLVHLDTDLYRPTLDCLRYFGPRLASGGVVVLDDYHAPKCPGIRQAVAEYAPDPTEYQLWQPRTEQLVLIKR
jgi:hypothetical protein